MHKGRREARAVARARACAMINCGAAATSVRKKKDDLKESHAALRLPGVLQGIISSRSCEPYVFIAASVNSISIKEERIIMYEEDSDNAKVQNGAA